MVKKSIFLHLKKRLKLFCIINVFFMIPFSSFGANSISWNSEEDLFSVQYEYLQPIITQYFIDNKSEIWLLFLIAHSKR